MKTLTEACLQNQILFSHHWLRSRRNKIYNFPLSILFLLWNKSAFKKLNRKHPTKKRHFSLNLIISPFKILSFKERWKMFHCFVSEDVRVLLRQKAYFTKITYYYSNFLASASVILINKSIEKNAADKYNQACQ